MATILVKSTRASCPAKLQLPLKVHLGPLLGGYVDDSIVTCNVIAYKSSVTYRAFRVSTYSYTPKEN